MYNNMLAWPTRQLGPHASARLSKAGVSSIGRLREILLAKPEEDSSQEEATAHGRGQLVFDDVSFSYGQSAARVLHHVSFTVEPGDDMLAILGGTGSGQIHSDAPGEPAV